MASEFEDQTRRLIALWLLKSTTGSFEGRADRRFEKTREEIGDILKKKERKLPESSGIAVKLKWKNEAISGARKTTLALREFNQVNPEGYNQLQEILAQHKNVRRGYLEFGGIVEEEVYIGIIQEILDVNYDRAKAYLGVMNDMALALEKDPSQLHRSLLSE